MFSLLAPAWLAAAATLLLPLVVHLLSRGHGRRIRVGSVRLLSSQPSARWRRLRLHRPLLLAVRLLLLTAVVLALARPRAAVPPVSGAAGPWLLVSPEVLLQRTRLEKENAGLYAELDRLWAEAATVRLLVDGLPSAGMSPPTEPQPVPLWSLLRQADRLAPRRRPLHLFSPVRVDGVGGERPHFAREVVWHAVTDSAENRWIEALLPADEEGALVGQSGRGRTAFRKATAAAGETATTRTGITTTVHLMDGGIVSSDDELAVAAAPPWVELRFTADRAADAAYLRAAVRAAQALGDSRSRLREVALESEGSGRQRFDLAFHLSPGEISDEELDALALGGVLVTDTGTRYRTVAVELALADDPVPVRIDRLGIPAVDRPAAATVLWRGVRGQPILVGERVGQGLWLRFHSRFHPLWTDFVHHPGFPRWVLGLLRDAAGGETVLSSATPASDRRELDPRIALPGRRLQPLPRELPTRQWPELLGWLTAAALIPFERWLAYGGRR